MADDQQTPDENSYSTRQSEESEQGTNSSGLISTYRRPLLKGIGASIAIGLTGSFVETASARGFDKVVEVEIKPGGEPTPINCQSRGVTPVAILTMDDFDATTVDPSSLRFGKPRVVAEGGGATITHNGGHTEDVDGDGEPDFVGHFSTQDAGFTASDTEGWVIGETEDGQSIVGIDSVETVGNCPEEADDLPNTGLGTVVEQTTGNVSEPSTPPDKLPVEGYPVSEEEFEELKEQASNGELPQPPSEDVEEEGSPPRIAVDTEFDGWESSNLLNPSDANIGVGPEKAVLAANVRWGIYDKETGNREFQVSLEDWFAPVIDEDENFVFDPKVLYDYDEDRFILIACARNNTDDEGSWVVAVSDNEDPSGTWYLAQIVHDGTNEWVDYPGLGVDQNGIYLTGNIFQFPSNFQYAELVSIDKTPLYNGNSFTYWWFDDLDNPDGSTAFTIQPTLAMSSTSSQYLVNSKWNGGNSLTLWELTNPTTRPRLSSNSVSVSSYSLPPNAEQPNSGSTLDTTDARLMNAVYEDGSVWTAHSIQYDWNNDGDASALLKWYEISVSSNSILQSRGWGRQDGDYYFPTIGTNGDSTMIVYNESGPNVNPRIEVAGRTEGFTQNSLQDTQVVKRGESEYNANRWGDYNGIVVDPETDRYWTHSQYALNSGTSNDYETWVGEVFFQSTPVILGTTAPAAVYRRVSGEWIQIGDQLTGNDGSITKITQYNGDIFAGVTTNTSQSVGTGKVYRLDDDSWTLVGDELDNNVCTLDVFNGELYAGTAYGDANLYRYDGPDEWIQVLNYTDWQGISAALVADGRLYVGDSLYDKYGYFDGDSLTVEQPNSVGSCAYDIVAYDGDLYGGNYSGILRARGDGSWSTIADVGGNGLLELETYDGDMYVGAEGGTLYRWNASDESLTSVYSFDDSVVALSTIGDTLYVGIGHNAAEFDDSFRRSAPGEVYTYQDGTATRISDEDQFGDGAQELVTISDAE